VKDTFGHTNDQLFYAENINKRTLKPFTGLVDDDTIKEFHEQLKPLKIKAEETNLKFLKYYALISFDGDNMGEWFSGENLKNPAKLLSFHKMLSKQLHQFANEASAYLNKYGKTVFAGEDFLGFINLMFLFKAVEDLQKLWKTIVNDVLGQEFVFKEGKKMTFSAGIVIAHYKQPLGLVLKLVREAATEAKKGEKNSFTLVAMKHSGNKLTCTYSFDSAAIESLSKIKTELESNFSSAFISKCNQVLAHLGNEIPEALVAKELKTNISRACKAEKQPGETDDQFNIRKRTLINELVKSVNQLISLNVKQTNGGGRLINDVSNLTQTFAILDFLKRKTN
jgi:CRISPR-associated protein Cmr2